MGIPDSALRSWSAGGNHHPAGTTSALIAEALEKRFRPLAITCEVTVVGSFANRTDLPSTRTVDLIARLDDIVLQDLSFSLDDPAAADGPSAGRWRHLVGEASEALATHFGPSVVSRGPCALAVEAAHDRLGATVIPCATFRRYQGARPVGNEPFSEGIAFLPRDEERWRTSFPALHLMLLDDKDRATGGRFRSVVRAMKGVRDICVMRADVDARTAPSYHLEGLLSNVPDEVFDGSLQDSFAATIGYLRRADMRPFLTLDRQALLFRPDGWSVAEARRFLDAVVHLWLEWPERDVTPIVSLEPEPERKGLARFLRR